MHTLGVGSIPRSIVVALEHDLVDKCKAGDDVVVTGTLTRRWSRISRGARCDLEVLVKANHVRIISDSHAGGIVTDGECRKTVSACRRLAGLGLSRATAPPLLCFVGPPQS